MDKKESSAIKCICCTGGEAVQVAKNATYTSYRCKRCGIWFDIEKRKGEVV